MNFGSVRLGPLRLLLLLILLLAAGLAGLWFDQHAQWRNLAWIAPKALPPELKVPASPLQTSATVSDPAQFAVILARPLFAPDRRPPPPPPPPPTAAELPPDHIGQHQDLWDFFGCQRRHPGPR